MAQLFHEILSVVLKSMIAAIVLFVLARLMGKKQISQLTFFDYTVGISIGSIAAAMSVDSRISIHDGIISMIIWAVFPIIFSYVSIHSIFARRMLDGTPTILVQNGKIIEKNLKKSKFTVNDLLEELRIKDIFNTADVDYAILETSGKLSVLKNAGKAPCHSIFANVIIDGKLMKENMKQMKVEESWLKAELLKNDITSYKDVLLASCDDHLVLYIDRKNSDPEDLKIFQ